MTSAHRTGAGGWRAVRAAAVSLCLMLTALGMRAQETVRTPEELIQAMISNENEAAARADRYEYLSNERSTRTGGHLWTERVVETAPGRVRLLLGVDGKPLVPERMAAERSRLVAVAARPEVFARHEQATRVEERRARDLLAVLHKDFLFEDVRLENGVWRLNFRPNPGYTPSGLEERVLHNMAGSLVIDQHDLRLMHMDFHLTQDVAIGFGLLGNVHTGTTFVSERQKIAGLWHTTFVGTQVHAKAVMFKSVDLNLELARSEFEPVDRNITVEQAVALLLK